MRNRLIDAWFITATVAAATPHGRYRYIRLRADKFRQITWTPGQQARLDCGDGGWIPVLRTYTIWDHADDWIDLYCLVHGDGPGSTWASTTEPGTTVRISRPQGDFTTTTATHHLFVGDETAAAAFGPMTRALPADTSATVLIEIGNEDDQLPIPRPVTWLHRPAGADPADPAQLVDATTRLDIPSACAVAYLAGEARTIQAVRRVLTTTHGWPRQAIRTKPFWTPGRKGME